MGQFSVNIADALVKLRAQRDTLESMAAPVAKFDWMRRSGVALDKPLGMNEKYGDLIAEAALAPITGRDFIFLSVIDWHFRIQRPQHLAANLADIGHRVFYVSVALGSADADGRFKLLGSPHPGVFEIRLRLTGNIPASIYAGFTAAQIADLNDALDEARSVLGMRAPVAVVQYPSWYPVATAIPGVTVLYDCLDFVGGFENSTRAVLASEQELIKNADILVTASKPLADHLAEQRSSVIVRNAAEVEFFGAAAAQTTKPASGPVIGYFGAIAEWFAVDWLVRCALARPDWQFIIVGEVAGADVDKALALPNVAFTGEKPYAELPALLSVFDVAIIPFKLTKLVECVNPVKLYEYMSQGKPVVSCAMPEVVASTELVYIALDENDFERQIALALSEDSPGLQKRRREWAMQHSWRSRAAAIGQVVKDATPRVSVVVLSYNNLQLTRACIRSILTLSDYPNFEVIVVDNASTDETPAFLESLELHDPRVRVIINPSNDGFAAGNNLGLRAATGDYLIVLNNDTYVTRGWIRDLIRPLLLDPSVGIVGPLTNNIGNEQKVSTSYSSMSEMAAFARDFTSTRRRQLLPVHCVAFFCAAMRRELLERVGYLDDVYGLGFFEDDDYCKRVINAGYKIVVADDVFVHHELSASFDKVPSQSKLDLMARNKAIFEEKWGQWKPHRYRDESGFGT